VRPCLRVGVGGLALSWPAGPGFWGKRVAWPGKCSSLPASSCSLLCCSLWLLAGCLCLVAGWRILDPLAKKSDRNRNHREATEGKDGASKCTMHLRPVDALGPKQNRERTAAPGRRAGTRIRDCGQWREYFWIGTWTCRSPSALSAMDGRQRHKIELGPGAAANNTTGLPEA